MSSPRDHLIAAISCIRTETSLALAQQDGNEKEERLLTTMLADLRRVEATVRAALGPNLPLTVLSRRLRLRDLDEVVLLTAAGLEIDPLFAIVLTSLSGEEPKLGVSPKLLAQVLGFAGDEAIALGLDDAHPLVTAGLLESTASADAPETLRPWRVRARVVSYLSGSDGMDPLVARCGGLIPVVEGADLEHARGTVSMLERVLASNDDVIVCLEGPDGVGRRTAVAAAAAAAGRQAVALDGGYASAERSRLLAELRALRRECWLRNAVPVLARFNALSRHDSRPGERFADAAEALESAGAVRGPAVITISAGTEVPDFQRRVIRLRLDPPSPSARLRIWRRALGPALADGAPLAGDRLSEAVQYFTLTPGAIHRAADNARMIATDRAVEAADLRAGVAAEIEERFSGLATRVVVSQRWEDLVLPADTLDDVRAFSARAAHASLVYDRWGFRDKLQRGLGLAALFSGPPGTGKTMVAGLIAQTLGLELYMVDLSQIVSKWVGETEKQLGRIFDAAAMGQALLLFDEADALFAKRTEVKSSNDRYANLEVNYLLQRIEQFGGVAVLTTNLEGSVDPAFKRRLAAEVRFYPPDRQERERLWRTLLPEQAPVAPGLNYGQLADAYKEMCGGHIRNAVLRAAFLAAAEGAAISQEYLTRAARVEYRSMGKVV